ncbi:MAG: glutamine synthetase III [Elusimicrobia bacterium]|nr:glutamine synthetase III [Elusimicrobiota bacterium]
MANHLLGRPRDPEVRPHHSNGRRPEPAPGLSQAPPGDKVSDYFACNVFNLKTMRTLLPKETFRQIEEAILEGKRLSPEAANSVASAMKTWAISKGATHYTHWFQPMTGLTAEKHDSFIELNSDGSVLESFTGKQLAQAEPDASSFPSGGLRTTFEARGYTAWDPTSPAFIMETPGGATLCIPTVFVSYNGLSLDKKTPLLRSIEALNRAALDILAYFKVDARRVSSNMGAEQEYFLIDRSYFGRRTDLLMAGRTLLGAAPPKGQQLEDHYFGSIKERVFCFMTDAERELYKLGVPVKTRHNEVAPNQFEIAPIHEEANVAVDHNQLVMDIFERVAGRHGLAAVFHEKPFAGTNGSGKHINWSLGTDTGVNLLAPGETPSDNLRFLVFLVCAVKAVHDHGRLLRASVASSGNDHRLGANEAPPAIMSVFLGEYLTKVLSDIERGAPTKETDKEWLNLGIDKIPPVLRDNTDRNRTSPFAFTGNKFEFRAVGSSSNCAFPLTIINAIVAGALRQMKKDIDGGLKTKKPFKDAVLEVLRKYVKESKRVCYEGNNYSGDWEKEAAKRGLPNVKTTPEALEGLILKESFALLDSTKILKPEEARSRYHIELERYAKDIDIEAKLLVEMVESQVLPAAFSYQKELGLSIQALKAVLPKHPSLRSQESLLDEVAGHVGAIREGVGRLRKAMADAEKETEPLKKAQAYCHQVKPRFSMVRRSADALEELAPDKDWPLPKYHEMLFLI